MKCQGYVHPAYRSVAREFISQIPQDGRSGSALSVYYRETKVVDIWAGFRDEKGNPWQEDTLALSFSTTKGVTATLLHILAEKGLIEYDKPVSHYWPEFKQAGKEETTVRHLLTHQAGLYNIREMLEDASQMTDWAQMIKVLEEAKPAHRPGADHGYHGLTYGWLVGEVLCRATGKSFSEILRTELVEPLQLDGMYVGNVPEERMKERAMLVNFPLRSVPPEERSHNRKRSPTIHRRMQAQMRNNAFRFMGVDPKEFTGGLAAKGMRHFSFNDEAVIQSCMPAANGMFTARSLAKMYAMLANGGELDGVRLVSSLRVRELSRVQSRKVDRVVPLPMHWRLGYHRVMTTGPRTPRAFGHFGYGGSGAWGDSRRHLGVGYTVNSRSSDSPFGDTRIMRLNSDIIRCTERVAGKRGWLVTPLTDRYYDLVNV